MATRDPNRAVGAEEALIDKAVYCVVSNLLDAMIWIVVLLLKGINNVAKDRARSSMSENCIAAPSMIDIGEE